MGAWFTFSTTTSPLSVLLSIPSLTVSANVNVAPVGPTSGAVNVGCTVSAPTSVTAGPAVCTHVYVSGSVSGSKLPVPSSVTGLPSSTGGTLPASATGSLLTFFTAMFTFAGALLARPSLTTSWKVS